MGLVPHKNVVMITYIFNVFDDIWLEHTALTFTDAYVVFGQEDE